MFKYVKKNLSLLLLVTLLQLVSSPCLAMDTDPQEPLTNLSSTQPTKLTGKSEGEKTVTPSTKTGYIDLLEGICKKEALLTQTRTYSVLSTAHFLLSFYYNSEDALYRFLPLAFSTIAARITPFLPEEAQPLFEIGLNEIHHQLQILRICQYTRKYAAEKALGYGSLFLMKAFFPGNPYFGPYQQEVEAAIYYFAQAAGWNKADHILGGLKSLSEDILLDSSGGYNREHFFASAAEAQQTGEGECLIPMPETLRTCQKLPLTCEDIERETDVPKGVCKFLLPSLQEQWPTICIPILENLNATKPLFIILGEYHKDEMSTRLILSNIVEFLKNNSKNNIKFFQETVPGSGHRPYQWLEKRGIPIIEVDSDWSEVEEKFRNRCQIIGGGREEVFLEYTKAHYGPQQVLLSVFGYYHTSFFAEDPFVQENVQPLFFQIYSKPTSTDLFPAEPWCPKEYHQRLDLYKALEPTFPRVRLKISNIVPETAEEIFSYLRKRHLSIATFNSTTSKELSKSLFTPQEINFANKESNWYQKYGTLVLNLLEKEWHPPLFTKQKYDTLRKNLRKNGGWYIPFLTLTYARIYQAQRPGFSCIEIMKSMDRQESFDFVTNLQQTGGNIFATSAIRDIALGFEAYAED